MSDDGDVNFSLKRDDLTLMCGDLLDGFKSLIRQALLAAGVTGTGTSWYVNGSRDRYGVDYFYSSYSLHLSIYLSIWFYSILHSHPRNIDCENFRIWAFTSFDCAKKTLFIRLSGDGVSRYENQDDSWSGIYFDKASSYKSGYQEEFSPPSNPGMRASKQLSSSLKCQFIPVSIHLSICISMSLSVYPFIFVPIYSSIYISGYVLLSWLINSHSAPFSSLSLTHFYFIISLFPSLSCARTFS